MSLKNRIKSIEKELNESMQDITLESGEVVKVDGEMMLDLLAEVIASKRENRKVNHCLVDEGIFNAIDGQSGLVDLVNMINESAKKYN